MAAPDYRKCRRKAGRWPAVQKVEPAEFVAQVKDLRDKNVSCKKIARLLHCGEKRVHAALKQWAEIHASAIALASTDENGDGGEAA